MNKAEEKELEKATRRMASLTARFNQIGANVAPLNNQFIASQADAAQSVQKEVDAATKRVHAATKRVHAATERVHAATERVHAATKSVHAAKKNSTSKTGST